MTNDFGDPNAAWERDRSDEEFFNAEDAQGHLLVVRILDVPQYFRSENHPDGMVYPKLGKQGEPFPNSVVRCAIADMNLPGEDGLLGKIYPEATLFPSSLTKPLKTQVGKMRIMIWNKIASDPKRGVQRNDPYGVTNMAGNEQAVAAAQDFLARHPEFLEIPVPEPYDGKPPAQQQWGPPPQYYQQGPPPGWNPVYRQEPPPQQQWGQQPGAQPYPQAQPQWQPQGPPQQQQQPPQWQANQWGSAVPQQQYGPPPQQQGPQQGGSFLDRSAAQNHWGQPQNEQAPF